MHGFKSLNVNYLLRVLILDNAVNNYRFINQISLPQILIRQLLQHSNSFNRRKKSFQRQLQSSDCHWYLTVTFAIIARDKNVCCKFRSFTSNVINEKRNFFCYLFIDWLKKERKGERKRDKLLQTNTVIYLLVYSSIVHQCFVSVFEFLRVCRLQKDFSFLIKSDKKIRARELFFCVLIVISQTNL